LPLRAPSAPPPAPGRHGLDPWTSSVRESSWTRRRQPRVPAAFVWRDPDPLIDSKRVPPVEVFVPDASPVHGPGAGHVDDSPDFRRMEPRAIDGGYHPPEIIDRRIVAGM
jgi:hypothetical protein